MEKFLEFNGKRIDILMADGSWWVAIKPICEALNVNYDRAYKNIMDDEILGQLYAKQHMVGADNRLREMGCLPEKYIYGWLFSIRSESPDLKKYKQVCYDILYNHFHGILTERFNTLQAKEEIESKLNELLNSEEIFQLKRLKKLQSKKLKSLDVDLMSKQIKAF